MQSSALKHFICRVFGVLFGIAMLVPHQNALADTFGGVGYSPPAGWKKEKADKTLRFSRITKGEFAAIDLFSPEPSSGDGRRDFDDAWRELVATPHNISVEQPECSSLANGWAVCTGSGESETNGGTLGVSLSVYSDRRVNVAVKVSFNSTREIPSIQAFMSKLVLPAPVAAPSGSVAAAPASGAKNLVANASTLVGEWSNGSTYGPRLYDTRTGMLDRVSGGMGRLFVFDRNGTYSFAASGEHGIGS